MVLVYDKKNAWRVYKGYGWSLSSLAVFRNQLVGMSANTLFQMLTGLTDAGDLIVGKAITGYLGDEPRDKCLDHIKALVQSCVSPENLPSQVKISTYSKGVKLNADWALQIPIDTQANPVQVTPQPVAQDVSFLQNGWARMWAIGIQTSEDTTGPYVAPNDQLETIAELYLRAIHTMRYYDTPVV